MKLPWRIALRALATVASLVDVATASSRRRPPLEYISVVENTTIETLTHRVHAFSHFDLSFIIPHDPLPQAFRISLEPNQEIIAEGASVQYVNADGETYRTEEIDRQAHKIFKGDVWTQQEDDGPWVVVGWARIAIRRDGADPLFEGAFSVGRDHHHVQLRSNYMSSKHALDPDAEELDDEYMTVFRDSDIASRLERELHSELKRSLDPEAEKACRSDQLQFNSNPAQTVRRRDMGRWGAASMSSLFGKRQIDGNGIPAGGNSGSVNLKSTIGQSEGCPQTRKVALIGVATDCAYTGSFNSSEAAHANVIQQVASASSVYEKTFNISLGLRNLTVMDSSCPGTPQSATPWNQGCNTNQTISSRLNSFSTWRAQRNDTNAYWTLLTNCPTQSEIGLAWLGQLCVGEVNANGGEVVSGTNIVARTSNEWQVIAHESGHTFGAVHDCDSQTCADSQVVNSQQCCPLSTSTCNAQAQYIMNPSSIDGIDSFSPCTVGNICSALGRNSVKSSCLSDNKGVTTITGNQCGNGIVEEGEECDCGGTEGCGNDACCDPTTCKFKGNAVCDDANDSCCKSCQFASAGTVCRASTSSCDPQEVCSGTNATCPPNQMAPDGQSCGNSSSNLQCASGQCTSRDQQCKTLMGSYTSNNDTYACDSQDCTLSCASPEFGPGVCYSMQQNFLDGTTCGGGGKCNNGQCQGSSTAKEIGSWLHDNRGIVIGICSAIGALLLLAILSCVVRRCRQPRGSRRPHSGRRGGPRGRGMAPPPPMMQHGFMPGWHRGAPPPPQPQGSGAFMSGGVTPGPNGNDEPSYSPWHPSGFGTGGPSVRYA